MERGRKVREHIGMEILSHLYDRNGEFAEELSPHFSPFNVQPDEEGSIQPLKKDG